MVFMTMALLSNILLATRARFFRLLLLLQAGFYGAAFAGRVLEGKGLRSKIFSLPYYFCLVNIAAGHALMRFLRGEKQVLWTPRKG